ncbi:hypothetical protein OCH239_10235 [Roseivivax halodurans JCM 10272]|uniref:Uncharacterized protein n=1 Tax=Roseivivax halodurans JCM 10272 TaxID=1449350 RepID=X7EBN4_9RHOB|nr:hypothetical protein OCH239_10235 [Roseivivax halodurans JCM 10272]
MQRAFPGSPLTVYTAETLRGREAALISRVIGLPVAQFRKVNHSERPGFSRNAVEAMRASWEAGRPWPHQRWREVVAAHPRSASPGFDPWSPEERDFFDRRHESDLEAIAALPGWSFWGWRNSEAD